MKTFTNSDEGLLPVIPNYESLTAFNQKLCCTDKCACVSETQNAGIAVQVSLDGQECACFYRTKSRIFAMGESPFQNIPQSVHFLQTSFLVVDDFVRRRGVMVVTFSDAGRMDSQGSIFLPWKFPVRLRIKDDPEAHSSG
jgi:hypothetical protein